MRRRWPLVVAAVAGLAAAGYAAAATVVVTLGPSGPQPAVVTVGWGETLELVNGDSVEHGLTSPRPELHADTIAPGATFTDVVTGRAGPFVYHQTGGERRDGTVVVVLSGTVSLRAADDSLLYGRRLRLSGKTTPAAPVAIEERLAGEPAWHTVATVTSGGDGAFAADLPLALGGRVRASIDGGQIRSAPVAVSVEPGLTLKAVPHRAKAGHAVRLRTRVRPRDAAKRVLLFACSPTTAGWRRVARAKPSAAGVAVFRWRAAYGSTRLRATVQRRDAAPGFSARTSATVAVTGTGTPPPAKAKAKHRPAHHC